MKELWGMIELVAVTQINTSVKNKTVQQKGKFCCMHTFFNLKKKYSYANIMGLGQTHDHILTLSIITCETLASKVTFGGLSFLFH